MVEANWRERERERERKIRPTSLMTSQNTLPTNISTNDMTL